MSFFRFSQNNSGGSFDVDKNVAHTVIVEANDFDHANERAAAIGIYFDWCESGIDCSCCGDRWYRQQPGEEEGLKFSNYDFSGSFGYEVRVHYLDGRVVALTSIEQALAHVGGAQ